MGLVIGLMFKSEDTLQLQIDLTKRYTAWKIKVHSTAFNSRRHRYVSADRFGSLLPLLIPLLYFTVRKPCYSNRDVPKAQSEAVGLRLPPDSVISG